MGNGFKKVKAAVVGTHKNSEKIPQWLKANGGQYSREIDPSVTHLIATESAMGNNPAVDKARSLDIKIVTYGWLEDSLLSKPCKPKPEEPYLLDRIQKNRERKYKVTKDAGVKRTLKGVSAGMNLLMEKVQFSNTKFPLEQVLGEFQKEARAISSNIEKSGYHLYLNSKAVSYSATLERYTDVNERSRKETLVLQVYERKKEPYKYMTVVKYTRIGISLKYSINRTGGDPSPAVSAFERLFRDKTGVDWNSKQGVHGKAPSQPPHGGWFWYKPPGLLDALRHDAQLAIGRNLNSADGTGEGNSEGGLAVTTA